MEINFLKESLSYIKNKDTSKGNSSFNYGITGLVIDKLETKLLIEFIRQIIRDVYNNSFKKEYKLMLEYIDPYLVKYDREIKKKSKNDIYGYIVKGECMYYNPETNRFGQCTKPIFKDISNYKKYILKSILKKRNKFKDNIISGIITSDRRGKKNVFQILDKSFYFKVDTQKKKESRRSKITGRTCSSIQINDLLKIKNKLGLSSEKGKKILICNSIELILRIYELNKKENKNWFINKLFYKK